MTYKVTDALVTRVGADLYEVQAEVLGLPDSGPPAQYLNCDLDDSDRCLWYRGLDSDGVATYRRGSLTVRVLYTRYIKDAAAIRCLAKLLEDNIKTSEVERNRLGRQLMESDTSAIKALCAADDTGALGHASLLVKAYSAKHSSAVLLSMYSAEDTFADMLAAAKREQKRLLDCLAEMVVGEDCDCFEYEALKELTGAIARAIAAVAQPK